MKVITTDEFRQVSGGNQCKINYKLPMSSWSFPNVVTYINQLENNEITVEKFVELATSEMALLGSNVLFEMIITC